MRSRRWLLLMVGILGLVAFGGGCASGPQLARVGLSTGEMENEAFRLHSYVLLTSDVRDPETPAEEEILERYRRLLAAFMREVSALDGRDPAHEPLKATYVVTREPVQCWGITDGNRSRAECVDSILDRYDYRRARELVEIMRLAGKDTSGDGPYIVSTLVPLTPLVGASASDVEEALLDQILFQDLSAVPPHIVDFWFHEFLGLTKKDVFWETPLLRQLALDLRTRIGVVAEGLTSMLDVWIVGPA